MNPPMTSLSDISLRLHRLRDTESDLVETLELLQARAKEDSHKHRATLSHALASLCEVRSRSEVASAGTKLEKELIGLHGDARRIKTCYDLLQAFLKIHYEEEEEEEEKGGAREKSGRGASMMGRDGVKSGGTMMGGDGGKSGDAVKLKATDQGKSTKKTELEDDSMDSPDLTMDDGALSSNLQRLCEVVRESVWKSTCDKIKTRTRVRCEHELVLFDKARRQNDVEGMKSKANFLRAHAGGRDALCEFVAKQATRPLWSAARAPPGKDDVALLFEQVRTAIFEAKATMSLVSPNRAADKDSATTYILPENELVNEDDDVGLLVEKMCRFMLADDGAFQALLTSWFPMLKSPPPGIALERIELLTETKKEIKQLIHEVLSLNSLDEAELCARVNRLFNRSASDYIILEISRMEFSYEQNVPKINESDDDFVGRLERALVGPYPEFLTQFVIHTSTAYERANGFLEDDARDACMETLTSCFLLRVVDKLIVPVCDASSRLFGGEGGHAQALMVDGLYVTNRAGFEMPSHELLVRASREYPQQLFINLDDDSLTRRIQFVAKVLIPFVEEQCDSLETLHAMITTTSSTTLAMNLGKRIKSIVDLKVTVLDNRLESILAKITDLVFYQAHEVVLFLANKNPDAFGEVAATNWQDDSAFFAALDQLKRACALLENLGEGVLTNLALAARELALARIGTLKKVSAQGGQFLARELNQYAMRVESMIHLESAEAKAVLNRVCSELRQIAHVFVMPKEEVLKGSLVLDKIGKEFASACVQMRR